MAKPDDGGPAFPQTCMDAADVGMVHVGMSTRDWFAGRAMQSLLIAQAENFPDDPEAGRETMGSFAVIAYAMADEMLKERARG